MEINTYDNSDGDAAPKVHDNYDYAHEDQGSPRAHSREHVENTHLTLRDPPELTRRTNTQKTLSIIIIAIIYRTQVNLGSDLWVRMSLRHKLLEVVQT